MGRIGRILIAGKFMRGAPMKSFLPALGAALVLLGGMAAAGAQAPNLDNATCLGCHGKPGFATTGANARSLYVPAQSLAHSVHGKLTCVSCHTTITEIPHKNPPLTPAQWRQQIPKLCGSCHTAALNDYTRSTHGKQVIGSSNVYAAVCTDCHTTHAVAKPQLPATRLAITDACGGCHAKTMASYQESYHGKLFALGYANIATCADCHSGHAILPPSDPTSSIAPGKVLATCRNCHADATAGFATFQAHATTDDFAHYPYSWIAAKFVWMLIIGTFGVFWAHSLLWFYRELRDRQQRRLRPHVRAEALPRAAEYVERWSAAWRWAHFFFAGSVIVLIMTGIPLLYPNSDWAPVLIRLLGGAEIAGIVHRTAGVVMLVVFVAHLVYIALHLWRNWASVRLFGPYSLLPTWQDGYDILAMLKWFFGRGPRPVFDHWNYQQKFDYWAPFWGVTMLVATGAMLWFKSITATVLPGWSFDVATVVHGDEAVLAAVYLFTIHFFANHWRPDKFPLDIVIFTGSMPLEEFKREYGVEYARLKQTGEIDRYLVQAPSPPMRLGSELLGFALVAIGLALLIMMVIGFAGTL
jgi:cytochrome b subunit of formate dehydrogenase/nitrate/TMAO reductase-like tetraheme cytochrome c subunit